MINTSAYYIAASAIAITLNVSAGFAASETVQVSVASGAAVKVSNQLTTQSQRVLDLGYTAALEYRTFRLTGVNTVFGYTPPNTYEFKASDIFVYLRLDASNNGGTGELVFLPYEVDYDGRILGEGVPSSFPSIAIEKHGDDGEEYYSLVNTNEDNTSGLNNYFLHIATIGKPENERRDWATNLQTGQLETAKGNDEKGDSSWEKMFKLINNLIQPQKPFEKIFFSSGVQNNVAVVYIDRILNTVADSISGFASWSQDHAVATTKSVASYISATLKTLESKYFRKDQADATPYEATFGDVKVKKGMERRDETKSEGNLSVENDTQIGGKAEIGKTLSVGGASHLKGSVQVGEETDRSRNTVTKFGDVLDNFETGHGAVIRNDGSAAFDNLEVRYSFRAMELVVNELQINSGDRILSEGDTIEAVEQDPLNDKAFVLKLKSQHENYVTGQRRFNVIRGIINTLAKAAMDGSDGKQEEATMGEYYTCWLLVNEVEKAADNNKLYVQMYADEDVPGGKNYPPCELMVIQRWGNAVDEAYQSVIYESGHEGRTYALNGVTKPIVSMENYGYMLGKPTDDIFEKYKLYLDNNPNKNLLYVDNILAKNFKQIDKQGKLAVHIEEYPEWVSGQTYYFEDINPISGYFEVSHVWHHGCKWMCLHTGTEDEPTYKSQYWILLEGYNDFSVDFEEIEQLYDIDNFQATLTIVAKLGYRDVTADILMPDIVWTRVTKDREGNAKTDSDEIWNLKHSYAAWQTGRTQLKLSYEDLNAEAGMPSYIAFKATVTLRDGEATMTESAIFMSN